jgi:hypothetical protein
MRDRRQPRSNKEHLSDAPLAGAVHAAPVARVFAPTDLDLDDLAEAIRSLLGPARRPEIGQTGRPNSDLLSLPRRGTHVVEAREAH